MIASPASTLLAKCEIGDSKAVKRWHEPGVMAFLRAL
jgi:hypothetical protein